MGSIEIGEPESDRLADRITSRYLCGQDGDGLAKAGVLQQSLGRVARFNSSEEA